MAASVAELAQLALFESGDPLPPPLVEVRGDDYGYLRLSSAPDYDAGGREISVVDLFSGCGGISLGVREACHALGLGFHAALAADFDADALNAYSANMRPAHVVPQALDEKFSLTLGARVTRDESALRSAVGRVDLLVGGPPCQGHSDLNNSTRRDDPKNSLYGIMARAAEVFEPAHILIENVVGAAHDRSRVVQTTRERLEQLGYRTALGIIDGSSIGIPQRRRRLVLLGSRERPPIGIDRLSRIASLPQRDVAWAIDDLQDVLPALMVDEPSKPNAETLRRIAYLFEHGVYDLPDEMRPPCHRNKRHSYKSIYGRLRWDQPAQTITSGFYSMCMGRYVHPAKPRTLTAHEASRLQFFPDFFDFSQVTSRTSLARIIGNAVPMKLAYIAALSLLNEAIGG
jgi:DNA (cytosine-5)-methyltransferase 1